MIGRGSGDRRLFGRWWNLDLPEPSSPHLNWPDSSPASAHAMVLVAIGTACATIEIWISILDETEDLSQRAAQTARSSPLFL
ncbi:MAG: hypothetical protein AAGC62_00130 [Pseudomonadota bacterium]